jgi:radical SAM protein with 4Fe4S-binding SPASM domain
MLESGGPLSPGAAAETDAVGASDTLRSRGWKQEEQGENHGKKGSPLMAESAHSRASAVSDSMPSFAWIALTSKCNLKCTHCQREFLKSQGLLKPRVMSQQVFEQLESEVLPHLERVQFGGNNFGEQLATSRWDDVFETVGKHEMDISIVTNGMLLNGDRIRAMVDAGVEFNFSLEGASKSTYEAVRGRGFDEFIGIVEQVCREKSSRPETCASVNLGFTLTRDNVRELPDLLELAARLGADRVIVTHFAPWQESQRRQSLVYHKELCNEVLERARNFARGFDLRVDLPEPFGIDADGVDPEPREPPPRKPCYHPWKSFSVNEEGDVMPCCSTSVVMGNLEKSSFHDIWNGRRYRKLRKTVNSSHPLIFCRDCPFRSIDPRSEEQISFWSDEKFLLAAIGTEKHLTTSSMALRKLKTRLKETGWGQKALPHLTELYRRHAAFYVTGIVDKFLLPLTRRR